MSYLEELLAKSQPKESDDIGPFAKIVEREKSSITDLADAAAAKYGVDPNLVRAVIHQESGGNPSALSPKGAAGLMQLMPDTATRFGVTDRNDPAQNIDGGVKYLAWLGKRFNGDTDKILAGYNAGEGNVDKYGGIPPFKETQNYVSRIKAALGKMSPIQTATASEMSKISDNDIGPFAEIVAQNKSTPVSDTDIGPFAEIVAKNKPSMLARAGNAVADGVNTATDFIAGAARQTLDDIKGKPEGNGGIGLKPNEISRVGSNPVLDAFGVKNGTDFKTAAQALRKAQDASIQGKASAIANRLQQLNPDAPQADLEALALQKAAQEAMRPSVEPETIPQALERKRLMNQVGTGLSRGAASRNAAFQVALDEKFKEKTGGLVGYDPTEDLVRSRFETNNDKVKSINDPQGPIDEIVDQNIRNAKSLTTGILSSLGATLSYTGRKTGGNPDSVFDDSNNAPSDAAELGDAMQRWANNIAPDNPNFYDKVIQGVGSMASMYIPGLGVARGAEALAAISKSASSWGASGIMGALESAAQADGIFKELKKQGYSDADAMREADKGFLATLPVTVLSDKLAFFNNVKSVGAKVLRGSIIEGPIQEGSQQVIQNALTNKPLMENVAENAAIGAIIGGPLAGMTPNVEPQSTETAPQPVPRESTGRIEPTINPVTPTPANVFPTEQDAIQHIEKNNLNAAPVPVEGGFSIAPVGSIDSEGAADAVPLAEESAPTGTETKVISPGSTAASATVGGKPIDVDGQVESTQGTIAYREPEKEIVTRKNGSPFKTEQSASVFAKLNKIVGEIQPVDGGFVIKRPKAQEAPTESFNYEGAIPFKNEFNPELLLPENLEQPREIPGSQIPAIDVKDASKPELTLEPILNAKDKPFKSEGTAKAFAIINNIDATPVAVDGGFALTPSKTPNGLPKGTITGGKTEIAALYDEVTSGKIPKNEKRAVRFAVATGTVSGIDVDGFSHAIDSFAINKVRNDHGTEETEAPRGQLPIKKEDFLKIPDVVSNYDSVEAVGKDKAGRDLIRYSKRYNGTTYYVEEVRTGRKELMAKTLWKTRTAMTGVENDPSLTPEAFGRNSPQGNKIIAQPEAQVNPYRPLVEALIKRRAVAKEVGKSQLLDVNILRAKKLMSGGEVSAATLNKAANQFEAAKDTGTAEILRKLAEERKKAGRDGLFSRGFTSSDTPLTIGWKSLAEDKDVFQYPVSDAKTISEIAKAKGNVEVTPDNGPPHKGANFDREALLWMPSNSGDIPVSVRFDDKAKEVWINAAALKSGESRGSLAYDIVANWAKNNGYVFKGDPDGLSLTAERRRTENMISSALKYGTTDHLAPHEKQLQPDAASPFSWKVGDTEHNLNQMLQASYTDVVKAVPEIANVRYDFKRGGFYEGSKPVTDADFKTLAESPGARAARAGSNTLKRAAYSHSLLQNAGREGWHGLLAGDAKLGSIGGQLDPALKGVLYKESTQPTRGLRKDAVDKAVERISKDWVFGPDIHVVQSINELPKSQRDFVKSQKAEGDVQGMYWKHDKSVWLVADNLNNVDEAKFTLLHEVAGHYSLREVFGPNLTKTLKTIHALNKTVQERTQSYKDEFGYSHDLAIEEALADIAGEGKAVKLNGWKRFVSTIKSWMLEHGFSAKFVRNLSDADVQHFLARTADQALSKTSSDKGEAVGQMKRKSSKSQPSLAPNNQGFDLPKESRLQAKIRTFQDRYNRVEVAQKVIKNIGGTIDKHSNAYRDIELYPGVTEDRINKFNDNLVKPLRKAIQAAVKEGITLRDIQRYLIAKHAHERNDTIRKRNPAFQDAGSGYSDKEAHNILNAAKKDGTDKHLEPIVDAMRKISDFNRKTMLDFGLESPVYVQGLAKWKNYIPLKTVDEDGMPTGKSIGKGFNIQGRESKMALGRNTEATDIIENMLMQSERLIIRASKNEVAKSFLNLVLKNPNPKVWKVFKVKMKTVMGKNGLATQIPDVMAKHADNVINVKIGGHEYHIEIMDEKLARAMKNLGEEHGNSAADRVIYALGMFNRYQAIINTQLNTEFAVTNMARDIQTALINVSSEQSIAMAKDVVKNLIPSIRSAYRGSRGKLAKGKYDKYYHEWTAAGGKVGFVGMTTIKQYRRTVNHWANIATKHPLALGEEGFKAVGNFILDWNSAVEGGTRLSAYIAAREHGLSEKEAASLSRNITLDFNKRGEVGLVMNALYLFSNASVQGIRRFGQFSKSKKGLAMLGLIAASGFILDMYNRWASGDDDEDNDRMSDYEKALDGGWESARNLLIVMPDGSLKKFPLPYVYNIPYVLGQQIGRIVHGGDVANAASTFGKAVLEASNPLGSAGSWLQTVMPTVGDAPTQIAENRKWTGAPLRPNQFPGDERPDSQIYFKSADKNAVAFAKWMNEFGGNEVREGWWDWSPSTYETVFSTMFGGAGRFVYRVYNLHDAENRTPEKIPFIRAFYAQSPEWYDQKKFYENLKELNTLSKEIDLYMEKGRPIDELLKQDGTKAVFAQGINAYMSELKELRKMRDMIENTPTMSDDDKRSEIKAIENQIKSIQEDFNREYSRADKMDRRQNIP